MIAVIQKAFADTSASILTSKIQGNIVDLLMPPLRPPSRCSALVAGAAVNLALWLLAHALVARGYRLKA
jgi:ABC-2 type transport system permease protein